MTGHVYNPLADAVRAAHDTLAQDARPHLTVMRGGGGIPGQVRYAHPSVQPAPVLFDRAADPDHPVIPVIVDQALHLLVNAANASGSSRLVEAAELVSVHFLSRPTDDCPHSGIPRPGAS